MSNKIHGFTQQERDCLVSTVFSRIEKRADVIGFIKSQTTNTYSVISEYIGFQTFDIRDNEKDNIEVAKPYCTMKGTYQSPLLFDSVRHLYLSTAKDGSSADFTPDLQTAKRRRSDWIIDYDMHIWRFENLRSTFMGESIAESLKAAALCREKFCPPHIREKLKPIFVIIYQERCEEDDVVKHHIEGITDIDTVILFHNSNIFRYYEFV